MSARLEPCAKCGEPRRLEVRGKVLGHAALARLQGVPPHRFQANGPVQVRWWVAA